MGWSDKYKKSINCDNPKGFSQRAHCQGRKKKMKEAKDHEVSMAQSQLDKTIDNAKKLKKKLGTKEKNIPAWVQAKVTDTDHNMDAAASYSEETKSGDQGLRDWFGKSKSSDGKKGWVQLGGKYAGKPCARQPGQTSTPKCGSSKMKRNLDKDEEQAAFRRKNRQDPNQPQKSGGAKPTNVRTEDMDINEAKDKPGKGSGTKDACYHKVKSRYSVWPSAYASGALVKCRKKGAANWGNSAKNEEFLALPEMTDLQIRVLRNQGYEVEVVDEACWKGYEKKGMKTMFGKKYPNCVKKEETEVEEERKYPNNPVKELVYRKKFKAREDAAKKGETEVEEGFLTKKTPEELERIKKEKAIKAREKKIKTYAALMRHAKDKTSDVARPTVKKEEVGLEEGMRLPSQYGSVYIVTFGWRGKYHYLKMFFPQPNKPTKAEVTAAVDKVYPGARVSAYTETAVGQGDSYFNAGSTDGGDGGKEPNVFSRFGESTVVHKMGGVVMGKTHTNDGKNTVQVDDAPTTKKTYDFVKKKGLNTVDSSGKPTPDTTYDERKAAGLKTVRGPQESTDLTGDEYNKMVSKRQLSDKKRSRREADANTSTNNGQMEEVQIEEGTPAWQRKEGKNPEGGLNQKGVDSYRRANPGSKLKTAVTTEPSKLKKGSKAANRRKSFCSRMKGMKKKLTSAKTANDPDSRINKSLRKWNC